MKYRVSNAYTAEVVLSTNDLQEAIDKLKELEGKQWEEHLAYQRQCAENCEPSADFYPTYYIETENNAVGYSIINYTELERDEANDSSE